MMDADTEKQLRYLQRRVDALSSRLAQMERGIVVLRGDEGPPPPMEWTDEDGMMALRPARPRPPMAPPMTGPQCRCVLEEIEDEGIQAHAHGQLFARVEKGSATVDLSETRDMDSFITIDYTEIDWLIDVLSRIKR